MPSSSQSPHSPSSSTCHSQCLWRRLFSILLTLNRHCHRKINCYDWSAQECTVSITRSYYCISLDSLHQMPLKWTILPEGQKSCALWNNSAWFHLDQVALNLDQYFVVYRGYHWLQQLYPRYCLGEIVCIMLNARDWTGITTPLLKALFSFPGLTLCWSWSCLRTVVSPRFFYEDVGASWENKQQDVQDQELHSFYVELCKTSS